MSTLGCPSQPGVYLAGLRRDVPHVKGYAEPSEPLFPGSLDDFRAEHAGSSWLLSTLNNKVKVCRSCGKACAFTLPACNACGASLLEAGVSATDNIFMGYVYGIARGAEGPLTITLRAQTSDALVLDDQMSATVLHLNAIPTSVFIPDMRHLFADPTRALGLVRNLWEMSAKVALEQFWGDTAFREKYFRGIPVPTSADGLLEFGMVGFNYPPSMYQLHLQVIHLPLLPFHYAMALADGHFRKGRFYPLEYVLQALALGDAARVPVSDETDMDEIVRRLDALGVSYDDAYAAVKAKCFAAQGRLAWSPEDFEYKVVDGKVLSLETDEEVEGKRPEELRAADKRAISSYAKAPAVYYRFAKRPDEVPAFGVS